ncbi:MAG: cytochrome c biogenesis protein CcsA [Candidatus Omnitrophota bacterium]|nr:cytochrome c biogenesis protein CcsA [Candidatus Omnitrophota bacterium]
MLNVNLYSMLHIAGISLSYFIFFVATIAAVAYLIQDGLIKGKRMGLIFNRLPDLSLLDKLNYRSISLGFPLLTLAIISGFIWSRNIHGAYWGANNLRQIYSLVLWLIYAVILHARLSAKLRGKKVALLSIFAFCVLVFSLLASCR